MKSRSTSPQKKRRRPLSDEGAAAGATSTSVERAFAVLDILSGYGNKGLSLMETAQQLRMSKSTTHRYLITLEKLGGVERDNADRFRLGLKLIELAGITLGENTLHNQGETFLNELAEQTQETVHLAVPSDTEVVYIAKADTARSIRMFSYIGFRAPMYCTALGKAILAYSSTELVDKVVQAGLSPRTPHTITSRQLLLNDLEQVRSRGFSSDDEENELGVCCVGTPIFDYTTKVIGAISVSGPANRMTLARRLEFGSILRDTGLRLSKRMGYHL